MRRRMQSASPSYDSGMIICPTGAGVVVGVDLAKRSLAWVYRYPTTETPDMMYRGREDEGAGAVSRRWQDSSATIVGGRVLLTPPDSNELHCIDLRTGQVKWKQPRSQMNRLACADNDRLLLVSNRRLKALRLESGKSAWKKDSIALPRGVSPSGTGFVSDGKYHLPLSSAEVIAIDLADGRIVSRTAARDGASLGNLICHRGTVISQSGVYLDCFDQIDALRKRSEERLAKEPNDVEALRTLGEVAYNEARLSEALSLLERAYRAAPDDVETRDVLAECLAAALDEDFAAHRSRLSLLKELNDGGQARQMLIKRIEAEGLLQEGDALASAQACLDLYRLAGQPDEMLTFGRERQATVARWMQAQFAEIWERANAEERKKLESQFQREFNQLGDNPSVEDRGRFLQYFGALPMFEFLKLVRAREVGSGDQTLEGQQILLDLEKSDDAKTRAEAIVRIAFQLHNHGLHSLAAEYDQLWKGFIGPSTGVHGVTGVEELTKLAKSEADKPVSTWPRGKVNVTTTPTSGGAAAARVRSPMWGVRLERTDSILGMASAQISARGGELVLQDATGQEFFKTHLEQENQISYRQPDHMYGVSRGNLLVVSLGKQLVALNTLAKPDGLAPAVLWRVNLGSNLEFNRGDYFGEPMPASADRPGSLRAPRPMDEGKWIGVIGPVTSRGVVFQDQRRLVCVDGLSGDERWSRTDVPQGCDLFGDEQYVFAVPTGSTTARVYSSMDGRSLGKRKVPEWRQQLVTRGRQVICWKASGAQSELSALDALTGEVLWKQGFDSGSAVDVEMGRYVAVVETGGRVAIVDAADGATLVDYQAKGKPTLDEIHLSVGRDTFMVVAKRPRAAAADRMVKPLSYDSPMIDGEVYLFDRKSGEMRWSRPAEVVQQGLLVNQPADLPFIVFAGQVTRSDGGGSRQLTTVMALDKATGRTLYHSDELPQTGGGHCVPRIVDAASHKAAVEMAGTTVLLQFTSDRRPPEPPAMAEVESSARKASRGILGIFRNLGGR
jgi:outer membrane protein assembly factor BamB